MSDFITSIQHNPEKKRFTYGRSWLMKDYYDNYVRHYETKLTEGEFSKIFRAIMLDLIRRYLLNYAKLVFPYKMGYLTMVRMDYTKRKKNGELVWHKLVDWGATLDAWDKDRSLYEKRMLLYTMKTKGNAIRYVKPRGSFKNHRLYKFKLAGKWQRVLYGLEEN